MVSVSLGEAVGFSPQSLDVSVGDTVWFYTVDAPYGSFAIYNTTLNEPCIPIERFGDDAHRHVLIRVNDTAPMWFLGSRNQELLHCYPPAHFALNPGPQWSEFRETIQHSVVLTTITTTVAQPQPT